jgi:hypothetical protein
LSSSDRVASASSQPILAQMRQDLYRSPMIRLFAITLFCLAGQGDAAGIATPATSFAVVRNAVLIPVWINSVGPYPFLLDAAAQHTVVDGKAAAFIGLAAVEPPVRIQIGPSDPAPRLFPNPHVDALMQMPADGLLAHVKELQIANAFTGPRDVLVMDLSGFAIHLGTPVGGILGLEPRLGELTLDFARNKVTLAVAAGDPPADALSFERDARGAPLVSALIDGRAVQRLVIDTAFGETMRFPASYLDKEGLLTETTPRMSLRDPASGTPVPIAVRLSSLSVGSASIRNPLCIIQNGADPALGLGFLRHFRVTLNCEHNWIRLEPLGASPLQDAAVQGTGLVPLAWSGKGWTVHVAVDSPADKAGIRPGELVAAVNGEPAAAMPFALLAAKLRGMPGESVNVEMERHGLRERFSLDSETLF